jgi:hypothetical protein
VLFLVIGAVAGLVIERHRLRERLRLSPDFVWTIVQSRLDSMEIVAK